MKLENCKDVKNVSLEVKKIVENLETSKSLKMKQMFEIGLEIKEISKIMNVRYNFVYNVISNHVNINSLSVIKSKTDSKKDKVIELIKEGLSNIEISKLLRTNYNYIYKISKELKDLETSKVKTNK